MNAYEQVMSQAADKMTELYDKVKRQDDELATLRAQLAEAREALQPFAELLEAMNQHGWKKELDETESAFGIDETWLTIGDFRKAAKQVNTA